jgi:hypothetical protein
MAEATARRQDWAAKLNLSAQFGSAGPATYREVVEVLKCKMQNDSMRNAK